MKPVGSKPPGAQRLASSAPSPFQALRAYESTIGDLQSLRPPREELAQHRARLQKAVDAAVHMAGVCADEGGFRKASAANLANLVQNFSRMRSPPITAGIDSILALVGKEVFEQRSPASLSRWSPRHLSLTTNALGRCEGNYVRRGLTRLALALRELRDLGLPQGWDARNLSMMTNGLAKGKGPVIEAALARLALEICQRDPGSEPGWSAQPLAMMINGLGKGEGPAVMDALGCLAAVIQDRPLTPEQDWTARHIAMVTNGLAKGREEQVQAALTQLARAVLERDLAALREWASRDLAMTANGLAQGSGPAIMAALSALAQALSGPDSAARRWTVQDLAMMVNGLGKGSGAAIQAALKAMAQRIMSHELTPERGWSAQPLAMMINGLGKGEGAAVEAALTRLAECLAERELTAHKGWRVQHLAMVANGLGKGRGPAVQEALVHLARTLPRLGPLTLARGWTAQSLATVTHGLAKAEGDSIRTALGRLARAIRSRDLDREPGWTPLRLAIMINGLGRGEGADVEAALEGLARLISDKPLARDPAWNAQYLSMVANGLGKGRGPHVHKALVQLARAVQSEDLTDASGWTAPSLAAMISGLGKGSGHDIRAALTALMAAVRRQKLTPGRGWTAPCLLMVLDVLCQARSADALFGRLVAALVDIAGPTRGFLVAGIATLCRFSVADHHLQAARQLLEAFRKNTTGSCDERDRKDLLWHTTLLHFACWQQRSVDQDLMTFFARGYQYFLGCQVEAGGREVRHGDRWHSRWASAYWQPISTGAGDHRDGGSAPDPVERGRRGGRPVSSLQQKVFEEFRKAMPDHDVQMEVSIRDFPVDILIDGSVCVEVDGPGHGVLDPFGDPGPAAGSPASLRRIKDRFIDHMLRQFGYRVFRVAGGRDLVLQESVSQIRTELEKGTSAGPRQAAGHKAV